MFGTNPLLIIHLFASMRRRNFISSSNERAAISDWGCKGKAPNQALARMIDSVEEQ